MADGENRQIFLDDVLFAKNTMKRTWHKPVDDPRNPVMKLYSFWTGGVDGRSGGYLAGGSPESATLRDEEDKSGSGN